jgi:type III secretion protein K
MQTAAATRAVPQANTAPPGGVVHAAGSKAQADLRRLVVRYNLHPELDMHASWWPGHWPAACRKAGRFGPQGQAVLGQLLRQGVFGPPLDWAFDGDFGSPLKRLALLDARSLRLLAATCGLAVHRSLFRQWGWVAQTRRQARRWAPDVADFIEERVPALPSLPMSLQRLDEHPHGLGRLMLRRGHRLLMALLAAEGGAVLGRVRLKFPRHFAAETVPALSGAQRRQLEELVLFCIVPERVPEWDWLF